VRFGIRIPKAFTLPILASRTGRSSSLTMNLPSWSICVRARAFVGRLREVGSSRGEGRARRDRPGQPRSDDRTRAEGGSPLRDRERSGGRAGATVSPGLCRATDGYAWPGSALPERSACAEWLAQAILGADRSAT